MIVLRCPQKQTVESVMQQLGAEPNQDGLVQADILRGVTQYFAWEFDGDYDAGVVFISWDTTGLVWVRWRYMDISYTGIELDKANADEEHVVSALISAGAELLDFAETERTYHQYPGP